ncbi:MAG: hypothetical protein U5K32_05165 [Bacteroidales bacterium]|nr:hypothetical protein [Bacteroidales bacterium]
MRFALLLLSASLLLFTGTVRAQSLFDNPAAASGDSYNLGGFIRSGLYLNKPSGTAGIPVSFSGLGMNIEAGNGRTYKAFADLRYRYAREYGSIINSPELREAWAAWYTPYTELKAGKQIIKWSRMDFFRLQDNITPRNDLYRSFDPADRDLANIAVDLKVNPAEWLSVEALLTPEYRASVLYTGFMDLPDILKINDYSMQSGSGLSYGFRTEFFLRGFTAGLSYFKGWNPMPGLSLDTISMGEGSTVPEIILQKKTFKTGVLAADMEFVLGSSIIRAEAAWSDPGKDYRQQRYVMLPEVKWAAGIEHFFGDLQLILEYSGKYLIDYEEPAFDPGLPDEASLAAIGSLSPGQLYEYTSLQISSFNRLYNYQLDEYSHYAGLRLSYEKGYAKVKPSLNILYNITAAEYMLNPIIKINPSDNIEMIVGADIYRGEDDSLFDMISDRLNSIYTGLRIDF